MKNPLIIERGCVWPFFSLLFLKYCTLTPQRNQDPSSDLVFSLVETPNSNVNTQSKGPLDANMLKMTG